MKCCVIVLKNQSDKAVNEEIFSSGINIALLMISRGERQASCTGIPVLRIKKYRVYFFWEDYAMRPQKKISASSCIVSLVYFGRMRFDNKA
jgi:hypothetical protein